MEASFQFRAVAIIVTTCNVIMLIKVSLCHVARFIKKTFSLCNRHNGLYGAIQQDIASAEKMDGNIFCAKQQ